MPTSKQSHPVGTEVAYRHEGTARRAQVTAHHPVTGEVSGLVVYAQGHPDGAHERDHSWTIEFGVNDPKHAETPQHEIVDGHFKRR